MKEKIKLPKVWIDGKRVKSRAQCSSCYIIAENPQPPKDWIYINGRGFLCSNCQTNIKVGKE